MGNLKPVKNFLDEERFPIDRIRKMEIPCGKSFTSWSGQEGFQTLMEKFKFLPGNKYKVLDIGCGPGGSMIELLSNFPDSILEITGVDASKNMIVMAEERIKEKFPHLKSENSTVSLICNDVMQLQFDSGSFDLVYSRDTILYIKAKEMLFHKIYTWLKPRGKLVVTDYLEGEAFSDNTEVQQYSQSVGHNMIKPKYYEEILKQTGFKEIKLENKSIEFVGYIDKATDSLQKRELEFCQSWSQEDYLELKKRMNKERERFSGSSYVWIWASAVKE